MTNSFIANNKEYNFESFMKDYIVRPEMVLTVLGDMREAAECGEIKWPEEDRDVFEYVAKHISRYEKLLLLPSIKDRIRSRG